MKLLAKTINTSSLLDNISLDKYNSSDYTVIPGFCDVHVHFRTPGFFYKENMLSGSMSAARGGFTAVCTMPNLNPVPDSIENLDVQLKAIENDAVVAVYPYGTITVGQKGEKLSDMDNISSNVIGFSDDGKGIQNDDVMLEAMHKAKSLNKIIAARCEDNSLLFGGYIHKGEYALKNSHKGICSESEYKQIERDLKLVEKTGCKYHVCHISAKESVELIRDAKKRGLDMTCETAPHYLILDDSLLKEDGKFKMNPPIRSLKDKEELIRGVIDGTIDMIATDHAPHSIEEKSKGLKDSLFGVVGLETSFPSLYTNLVMNNIITIDKLIEIMAINPRKRFDIPFNNDYSVWNLNEKFIVNPDEFLTLGRATPFDGMEFYGKCMMTVFNGQVVYDVENY